MEAYAAIGIEDLFDRVRPETLGCADWAPVLLPQDDAEDPGEVSIARRQHSADVSCLRKEYVLDLSPADAIVLFQAEVYFDTRRPSFDNTMAECGVEEILDELGDAVVWWRPVASSLGYTAVVGTPYVTAQVAGQVDHGAGCERPTDRHKARWVMRRDFPEVDQTAVLMAPFCPASGELLEERSIVKATTLLFRTHESSPDKTRLTSVKLISGVPDWAIARLTRYIVTQQGLVEAYRASSVYIPAAENPARQRYVVVGIRKSCRGPPLLPIVGEGRKTATVTPAAAEWEPAECNTFRLPSYLHAFLARLGVHDVDVHGYLDGRRLAPYQAALQREDLGRLWEAIEQPFRVQKAMYRLRYGGRTAPELDRTVTARFIPHASASATPGSAEEGASGRPARGVPVARTFVHFGSGSFSGQLSGRPRCGSMPKLEVAEFSQPVAETC